MDPINDSARIFDALGKNWESDIISDIGDIERFFNALYNATNGQVIVDFLDTGNWDRLQRISIQPSDRLLKLIWREDRLADMGDIAAELQHEFNPNSVMAYACYIQGVRKVSYRGLSLFALNGHYVNPRAIEEALSTDFDEIEIASDDIFKHHVTRRKGQHTESIDFHATSIYSAVIGPKTRSLTSSDSRNVLYWTNLRLQIDRMRQLLDELMQLGAEDEDHICGLVMASRRLFEFVLKLRCCFFEANLKKKDFKSARLGELLAALSPRKNKEIDEDEAVRFRKSINEPHISLLRELAQAFNELSHFSGIPVDQNHAITTVESALKYCRHFYDEVC